MNLAPDTVTVNFQDITIVIRDTASMMAFKNDLDTAVERYKLFLEGTPYYPDIFEDAACGLCAELENLFSRLKTPGSIFVVQLYHAPEGHMAFISMLPESVHNCKRRLFKYLH